jgi:C_GCAxxG_C_C family probable redox protein
VELRVVEMQTKLDNAVTTFRGGYNCAQAVLSAHCEDLNLDRNTALRLACGFGAGMARRQDVCGAVSGGIIVLGLRHGRGVNDDRSATETTYARARDLMERFQQRHGTCVCRELLNGCNIATTEGQAAFKSDDLLNRVCVPCVQSVMTILDELG